MLAFGVVAAMGFLVSIQAPTLTLAEAGPASQGQGARGAVPAKPAAFFPSDEAIRAYVSPYVEKHQAKGVVLGLIEPDGHRRILILGEAGNGARPLAARSVFETGSITKLFTGTVLADMVRRGEVKLNDPVAKYLPAGVRVPSLNGRQITLVDLATHTSGLPRLPTGYAPPDPSDPFAQFSANDLQAFLNRYELDREPGAKFEYSNLGMGLLGYALARATGTHDFQTLVADRVLNPLRLSMTAYGHTPAITPWLTRGHDQHGAIVSSFNIEALAGGGGLNSNILDLLTYLDANIREPTSPLEQAMKDAQRGYRPGPAPGVELGLAWMTMTRGPLTLVGLNGNTHGYSNYIAFDPKTRAGVVVLTNSGGFKFADKIGRDLLNPERRPLLNAVQEPAAPARKDP